MLSGVEASLTVNYKGFLDDALLRSKLTKIH
jgi:hypothetical protein